MTIQAPQLDINTVAAGGGSRLYFRTGVFQVRRGPGSAMCLQVVLSACGCKRGHVRLQVGPQSAGAHPGPVCYRKPGGLLALTDANLALGRILPARPAPDVPSLGV